MNREMRVQLVRGFDFLVCMLFLSVFLSCIFLKVCCGGSVG